MAVAWQVKPLAELATLSIFQKVISRLAAPYEDDDSNDVESNDSSPRNTTEETQTKQDQKGIVCYVQLII